MGMCGTPRTTTPATRCCRRLPSLESSQPTLAAHFFSQAVEAAQLAEDLKVQLEHVQCKLKEIQTCMAENRAAKEKESFNLKRAQV